jgi:hypothetical protein
MRYLSVLIHFFIYIIYYAIRELTERLGIARTRFSTLPVWLGIFFLAQVFISNLSANRHNVLTKSVVYNNWYASFLDAATWCGQNLPADAYIMSVKPRIVYLLSNRHGIISGSERDVYSPEFEQQKLAEIKSRGVTHIIVDAISRATMENIHPVIQNNPDKFEKLPVPGLDDKCTVVRVRPY